MGVIDNWKKEIDQLLEANSTHTDRITKIMREASETTNLDNPNSLLSFSCKMDELSEALMNMSLDYARMGQHAKDLYNTLNGEDYG